MLRDIAALIPLEEISTPCTLVRNLFWRVPRGPPPHPRHLLRLSRGRILGTRIQYDRPWSVRQLHAIWIECHLRSSHHRIRCQMRHLGQGARQILFSNMIQRVSAHMMFLSYGLGKRLSATEPPIGFWTIRPGTTEFNASSSYRSSSRNTTCRTSFSNSGFTPEVAASTAGNGSIRASGNPSFRFSARISWIFSSGM